MIMLSLQEGMKHILYGLGDSVEDVEAASYSEAFKCICEEANFDKAPVDLTVPGSDGFRCLKALCDEVGNAPVVIASAMEGGNDFRRAMDCSASGFVPSALYSKDMLSALKLVFKGGVYLPTCLLSGIDGEGSSERRGRNKGKGPLRAR